MSNLSIIQALSQLTEEQNDIISTLVRKLDEAGVSIGDVKPRIIAAHNRYIEILGADEVPDNLP